jgi:hypothetical protein
VAISITFTKTNGFTETYSVDWDDAVMNRFLDWAKVAYPTITQGPAGAGPGSMVSTPPNNAQACRRAARSYVQGLKASIRDWEKQEALKLADVAPAAINDGPAA